MVSTTTISCFSAIVFIWNNNEKTKTKKKRAHRILRYWVLYNKKQLWFWFWFGLYGKLKRKKKLYYYYYKDGKKLSEKWYNEGWFERWELLSLFFSVTFLWWLWPKAAEWPPRATFGLFGEEILTTNTSDGQQRKMCSLVLN